jgi:hypothetical protein
MNPLSFRVERSEVEESRKITLIVSRRDPPTSLGMTN